MKEEISAGGIIFHGDFKNKIVLTSHKGISWSLPKGHLEEGETALTVAKREIYEETGISELELIEKLGTITRKERKATNEGKSKNKKEIVMFLFQTHQSELKPEDPKNPEAIWVDIKKAIEMLKYPEDKDFLGSNVNCLS